MEEKVLIWCPIYKVDYDLHFDKFVKEFKDYDLLFIENTLGTTECYDNIKAKGYNVIRHEWNINKKHWWGMLADCHNIGRKHMLENDYTHMYFTAPDIDSPKNVIEKLLSHKKNIVGFPTNIYGKEGPPFVMKDGILRWANGKFGMNLYNWDELNDIKDSPFKVYGLNGAALYSRSVFKNIPFRFNNDCVWGWDMWFLQEINDKGFQSWCDSSERAYNHTNDNPYFHFIRMYQQLKWNKRKSRFPRLHTG